jgi:hypothetical protein
MSGELFWSNNYYFSDKEEETEEKMVKVRAKSASPTIVKGSR